MGNNKFKQNSFLIIAIMALLAWAILSMKSCYDNKSDADQLRKAIENNKDTVAYWKNRYGQEIASKKMVEVGSKDADLFFNRDSVAKRFNTEPKKIIEYVQVVTEGDATIPQDGDADVTYKDKSEYDYGTVDTCPKVKYMTAEFKSPYYQAKVRVGDSGYIQLRSYDTISFVQKRGKSGGLFNKQYFTQLDVLNANQSVLVKSVSGYRIADNPRQKSIELYGQAGVSVFGNASYQTIQYVGAGIEAKFKRFSVAGSYNKAASNGSFVDVKLRYGLIRL